MATAPGARAALHPSWLINVLTKVKLRHHLDKAVLWQRFHNCSLDDLNHSKRGDERHRDLASYLKLDQYDADDLKDAITALYDRNHDLAPSSLDSGKIKKELVDLSDDTELATPLSIVPDPVPHKDAPPPLMDSDEAPSDAVCTTEGPIEAPIVKVEPGSDRHPRKSRSRSPSRKTIKVALKSTGSADPARAHVCSIHGKARAPHHLRLDKGTWVCKSNSTCALSKADLALQKNKKETRDKVDHLPAKPDLSSEDICRHISREARKGRYFNVGRGFFALSDIMPWASSHGLTRKNVLHALQDMVFQHVSDSRGPTVRYNLEQDYARKEVFIRLAPACPAKEF